MTKNVGTSTPSMFELKRRFNARNVYVAFSKKNSKTRSKKRFSVPTLRFKHPISKESNSNTHQIQVILFIPVRLLSCILPYFTAFAPHQLHLRSSRSCRFFTTDLYHFSNIFLEKWKRVQLYQYSSLYISFKCIKEGL